MNRKTYSGDFQVKSAAEGTVRAVFATLNVIDADKDVTLPGAFTPEPVRISAYNHGSWQTALPVGKGTISQKGNEAILDGQFFLGTTGGRETFATVKELGGLAEWSYGYDVLDSEPGEVEGQRVRLLKRLKVHEVSPVLLGAGADTRTLEMKSRRQQHGTEGERAELRFLEARILLRDADWQRLSRMIPR